MNIKSITDWVDYGFIGLLGFLSIIALWLILDRYFYYRHIDLESFQEKEELEIALGENMTMIASIGANAPFIGLLGTVVGIMVTFITIGQSGLVDTKEIMVGLALALKTTAGGILVAIPVIWLYNLLARKAEILIAKWEIINRNRRYEN
ncbi:TonB-system energizer ExbB [Hydrogenimonas thermophila]|uniref:Biopolymer transport protein ExbB n=1 Tax=Hydrogenimonas thermophila TaxID=223786 RepID=A0A1I5LWA1_9BACT|nr:TonB-system energizer ExbB [Hydrogenimonas thermophila]WOE70469.1 TonB-system energizer ExbB [Hydrogenimonas thermophila]WOE72986.1 TonB-system energizer ExbB [Hydrogenimonas thermophila]SFP01520.1 biopolymer transport protein ExbB [Hydrogenimonas thermophila]